MPFKHLKFLAIFSWANTDGCRCPYPLFVEGLEINMLPYQHSQRQSTIQELYTKESCAEDSVCLQSLQEQRSITDDGYYVLFSPKPALNIKQSECD